MKRPSPVSLWNVRFLEERGELYADVISGIVVTVVLDHMEGVN